MGVNSLPKTVTRQRRGCDLNPGPYALESSTLTTRLLSHPHSGLILQCVSMLGPVIRRVEKIQPHNALRSVALARPASCQQVPSSVVTMRWLLRLVTGGPLVVAPPPLRQF